MADPAPSGLLLVDKPHGITSHDAVSQVRRALGVRKVGHAGTLDPMATGLLVMGVGRGTRLLRFLGEFPKLYEGTGVLGVETTTLLGAGRTSPRFAGRPWGRSGSRKLAPRRTPVRSSLWSAPSNTSRPSRCMRRRRG